MQGCASNPEIGSHTPCLFSFSFSPLFFHSLLLLFTCSFSPLFSFSSSFPFSFSRSLFPPLLLSLLPSLPTAPYTASVLVPQAASDPPCGFSVPSLHFSLCSYLCERAHLSLSVSYDDSLPLCVSHSSQFMLNSSRQHLSPFILMTFSYFLLFPSLQHLYSRSPSSRSVFSLDTQSICRVPKDACAVWRYLATRIILNWSRSQRRSSTECTFPPLSCTVRLSFRCDMLCHNITPIHCLAFSCLRASTDHSVCFCFAHLATSWSSGSRFLRRAEYNRYMTQVSTDSSETHARVICPLNTKSINQSNTCTCCPIDRLHARGYETRSRACLNFVHYGDCSLCLGATVHIYVYLVDSIHNQPFQILGWDSS